MNKRNKKLAIFVTLLISLSSPMKLEAQDTLDSSFSSFTYMFMINNYNELKEEDKDKALKFLISYLKSYDKNLYGHLQNELRSLSSMNRSSLELISVAKCKKNEVIQPKDTYDVKLNKYRCHFLNINAQKKFLSLESVIEEHLNPLIDNIEFEMSKKGTYGLISKVQLKTVVDDLKRRIARVKAIKNYYGTDRFIDAEREINQAIKLFDV